MSQPFSESSIRSHTYFLCAVCIILAAYLLYIYFYNHKEDLDLHNYAWTSSMDKNGITKEQMDNLSHDESVWYYKKKSTCVGYGEPQDECLKHESFCSGEDFINTTFGSYDEQAKSLHEAFLNGGIHPECPIIYSGAD